MLDVNDVKKINALPSPRILNTHYPPHVLPAGILEKRTKIVFVYRNPKSVAISAYFQYGKRMAIDAMDVHSFVKAFPTTTSKNILIISTP